MSKKMIVSSEPFVSSKSCFYGGFPSLRPGPDLGSVQMECNSEAWTRSFVRWLRMIQAVELGWQHRLPYSDFSRCRRMELEIGESSVKPERCKILQTSSVLERKDLEGSRQTLIESNIFITALGSIEPTFVLTIHGPRTWACYGCLVES